MQSLSEKLLAVLLTLLLGLSPLQGAIAGIASSAQEGGLQQMADMQADHMVVNSDHAAHDCDQCNADDCCGGHSCSSAQCASCVLAVISVFSHPIKLSTTSEHPRVDDGFASQPSFSLFRPPKA